MTVHAVPGQRTGHAATPERLFEAGAPLDPAAAATLLDAALEAPISHSAYRVLTAVTLRLPGDIWLQTTQIADAAGITLGQSRRLVGELANHGLMTPWRTVVRDPDGTRHDLKLYRLAVQGR